LNAGVIDQADSEVAETRDSLRARLSRDKFLILDGGLATELECRGCDLNNDLWSAKVLIDNPEEIKSVHTAYLEAGCDIITTASYQASFEGFEKYGFDRETASNFLKQSVQIAQEARSTFLLQYQNEVGKSNEEKEEFQLKTKKTPLIAASVGCYGAFLADGSEYDGSYGVELGIEMLMEWHSARLDALLQAGPDIIAFETIPCLEEVEALVNLTTQYALVKSNMMPSAWISFVCQNGTSLASGQKLSDAVQLVDALDTENIIAAVGINCTAPQYVLEAARIISSITSRKIIVYPNRGENWDSANHEWTQGTGTSDADLAALAAACFNIGVNVFGGCCRTSPSTIELIKKTLESM